MSFKNKRSTRIQVMASYSDKVNYYARLWLSKKITREVDIVDGGDPKDPFDFYRESVVDGERDEVEHHLNYVLFLRWLHEKHPAEAPVVIKIIHEKHEGTWPSIVKLFKMLLACITAMV